MISVLVDVYRGDVRVGRFLPSRRTRRTSRSSSPARSRAFASSRRSWTNLSPLSFERFQSGLALFTLGLAKKLAIADNLAIPANKSFADPAAQTPQRRSRSASSPSGCRSTSTSPPTATWRAACRACSGIELPVNFRFPYGSSSPSEFWRRWHMTLSRWLRDYVYIPLGGNRGGRLKTYRNLMITMTVGGLWHGAGLQFLVWGFVHGVFLSISHALRGRFERPSEALHLLGGLITLSAVFFAWIFFRANSLPRGLRRHRPPRRPARRAVAARVRGRPARGVRVRARQPLAAAPGGAGA